MTPVRANWFLDHLAVEDDQDPFAMPVEEVGERIDLLDPAAALEIRVHELLRREAALFDQDITCKIKDRADTACHACPISQAHDHEGLLGALCRLGRAQEATMTELAVLRCQDA